ncbi:hypothetical protein EYC80_001039 [Monilinia laxa]|uniref:Uncharacterized protein n=1 Tax=Monilinia laxa TaxID=61186 RepID=A0A5N6K8U4_MONLA|nr:hypothetical protein EYC80_001039 [Monilinia laxa]
MPQPSHLQWRTNPREISSLSRVVPCHTQVCNSSQQELQLSVSSPRGILWNLMTCQVDCRESESSLRVPSSL